MVTKIHYKNINQTDFPNISINKKKLALMSKEEVQALPLEQIAVLKTKHLKYLGYSFMFKLTPEQLGTIIVTRLACLTVDELKNLYKIHKSSKYKTKEIKKVSINGQVEFITIDTGLLTRKIKKAIQIKKANIAKSEKVLDLNKEIFTKQDVAQYFCYHESNTSFYKNIGDIFDENGIITNEKLLEKVNELYPGDEKFKKLPRLYSLKDLETLYNVSTGDVYERIRFLKIPYLSVTSQNTQRKKPILTEKEVQKLFEIQKIN